MDISYIALAIIAFGIIFANHIFLNITRKLKTPKTREEAYGKFESIITNYIKATFSQQDNKLLVNKFAKCTIAYYSGKEDVISWKWSFDFNKRLWNKSGVMSIVLCK
jgi:hypothetical protein